MSFPDSLYFYGDSHMFDYAAGVDGVSINSLGPGALISHFDEKTLRPGRPEDLNHLISSLQEVKENSCVIFSCLDQESRIAMGERSGNEFEREYERSVHRAMALLIKNVPSSCKVVIAEIFSIANEHASEQTCTTEKRLKNRKLLNSFVADAANQLDIKCIFHSSNPIFTGDDGFVKDSAMIRDGVHYNFGFELPGGKTIRQEVTEQILESIK